MRVRCVVHIRRAAFGANDCISQPVNGSVFCLVKFEWPAEAKTFFEADTAFTKPGEGIVRYENGAASRAYTVFNAVDFPGVVKHLQYRFGPPMEREVNWIHMLEAPKLPNTTFRWISIDASRRQKTILEVRNYDDLRRSFADFSHGMVRIYADGSRPIFKHLTTMDLMILQRRRIAQEPPTDLPTIR